MGGEESGSAVAAESGINRSKIYDILNQLVDMKAVDKVSIEGRTRYVAVPPDHFFPRLLQTFESDINSARDQLNTLRDLSEEVDPTKFTIRTLSLDEIDTNSFDYLISTNENCRVKFTEKLDREARPDVDVRIFDLNDHRDDIRGLILLVSSKEAFIFGTPAGRKVEAIHITSSEIARFLEGLIENAWVRDIPPSIMEEIETNQRNALVVDKAVFVRYEMTKTQQEYVYRRPVSMLITDEHISFFYEGEENPKIPLISLSEITLNENMIRVRFANKKTNELIGELNMRIVGNPVYVVNILKLIKTMHSN
jgi:sugar-specific transcriptional regulator TrmB